MPEESLITPALRARVGVASPRGRLRINRQLVSRSMETMQDGGAPIPGEGEVVPGYVLLAAGGGDEPPSGSPNVLPTTLMVSSEWRFERPLRMGDEFEVSTLLAHVSERPGRFGHAVYLRNETHYRDEAGHLVAVTAMTMMQYDAANAPGGASV